MNYFLKIAELKFSPSNIREVMYKDGTTDEWFIGPKHNITIGDTCIVEISERKGKDGYRHIISFI